MNPDDLLHSAISARDSDHDTKRAIELLRSLRGRYPSSEAAGIAQALLYNLTHSDAEEIDLHDTGAAQQAPRQHYPRRKLVLRLAFVFWLISLVLPALISPRFGDWQFGFAIFLSGWLGIIGVAAGMFGWLAWWANPIFLWAMVKAKRKEALPQASSYFAVCLGALTPLVTTYPVNEGGTEAAVLGYGPGAVLWFLALLGVAYVAAREAKQRLASKLVICATVLLLGAFLGQIGWRAIDSNASERDRLPFYAAKRGPICSATATALPINEKQPALALEADSTLEADSKHWLNSLRNWGVAAVQVGSTEYVRAPEGTLESRRPPYMIARPITSPARYTLHAEGGYPYINQWGDPGDFVHLSLIDNRTDQVVGQLDFRREMTRDLGFCPPLNKSPKSQNEEVLRWLAPFLAAEGRQ